MTEHCDWGEVSKTTSNGGGDYLKLQSGNQYRIRPVFSPVKFFKYFHMNNGKLRTGICGNPDTCPVRDRHPELKKPSLRFAAYVIDRADGKVKILEAPQTVFRPIGSSFELTGKNPGGGKDGSDWGIKVSGKGMQTKYDVMHLENTPLTAEERTAIKEALGGDKQKLTKLYKVDTPEELEKKLFGELEEKSNSSATAPSVATTTTTDAASDDFDIPASDDGGEDFDSNW